MLLIFKEDQAIDGVETNEIFFTRAHDALKELYDGPRLGKEGVVDKLELQTALEGADFENFNLDFKKFDKVLFYRFFDDVRQTDEVGDLFDLIAWFKSKTGYSKPESPLARERKPSNLDTRTLDQFMKEMRGIKTEAELDLLRKAIDISTLGQAEVMKAMKPGLSETEIQGIHEFVFKKYQAEYEGYPSIVGAGNNGCTLHYIENYKPKIEDGENVK